MPDTIPNLHQWERGPKITAIGGGTGLSTMLRGLKKYTKNLTAVVTVADDGGGSGVLRRDIGMPPPGDIRHCMESLANVEPIMERLLTYRFQEGSLAGQSFGNLILAALNGVTGSFEEAVAQMSQVLAITGRILPVTSADVQLEAVFENGARVVGESKIFYCKRAGLPHRPCGTAPGAARRPPGRPPGHSGGGPDPDGTGQPVHQRHPQPAGGGGGGGHLPLRGAEIYVCNIMTQEGETEGYTAADHVDALLSHGAPGLVDLCLANSAPVRPGLVEKYREEDAAPILVDRERIRAMGLELEDVSRWPRHGGDLCPPRPGPAGGGGAGRVPPAGGAHLPGRTAVHH